MFLRCNEEQKLLRRAANLYKCTVLNLENFYESITNCWLDHFGRLFCNFVYGNVTNGFTIMLHRSR